jgi:hypothetical protein
MPSVTIPLTHEDVLRRFRPLRIFHLNFYASSGDDLDCGAFPPLLFLLVPRPPKKNQENKSGGKAPQSKWAALPR